ncbi:hypothetical protein [uncultured Duncaniella sp.]|uniref:hypothetical protein n=1 Tax=uncultured Duncaniella sp. TaxID=2768039 RepID=UPI0026245528|nr:hypothetical protein [uncultured Duncaniella sp.]
MSLYGVNCKVDGVPVGLVMRETYNGAYILVIEREKATLEQIEAINWDSPEIVSKPGETCILPVGYGFVLEDINYSNSDHTWKVKVSVGQQYLGDVTGYAAQVAEKDQQIAALQDAGAQKDRTISQQADQISQQTAALTQKTTQISQQTSTIHQLEQQLAEADELAIALYEAQAAAAVPDVPDVPNEANGADEAVQGADETTEEV